MIFSKEDDTMSDVDVKKSLMCLARHYERCAVGKSKPHGVKKPILKEPTMVAAVMAYMVNAISVGGKDFLYWGVTASKMSALSMSRDNPFGKVACKVGESSWHDIFKGWASDFKKGASQDICKNIESYEGMARLNKDIQFKTKDFLKEVCTAEELKEYKKAKGTDGESLRASMGNKAVIKVMNDFVDISEQRMKLEGMPRFELPLVKNKPQDTMIAEHLAGSVKVHNNNPVATL